jgi:hypothetical protein
MATLNTKIKLYAEANSVASVDFDTQVILKDDGDGVVYIHEWNLSIAQPTAEQLANYETAGNTKEALQTILNNRATAYPTWQDQMDMQYKDLLNGTTTWKDAVAKVKSDNPKE